MSGNLTLRILLGLGAIPGLAVFYLGRQIHVADAAEHAGEVTAVMAWQMPFLSIPGAFDRAELEQTYKEFLLKTVAEIAPAPVVPVPPWWLRATRLRPWSPPRKAQTCSYSGREDALPLPGCCSAQSARHAPRTLAARWCWSSATARQPRADRVEPDVYLMCATGAVRAACPGPEHLPVAMRLATARACALVALI